MKADVTISQVYWNRGLMNFFFRNQAEATLNDLIARTDNPQGVLDQIDEFCETNDISLDDLEEMFYDSGTSDIIEEFSLESYFSDEEDEEEEDEEDEEDEEEDEDI